MTGVAQWNVYGPVETLQTESAEWDLLKEKWQTPWHSSLVRFHRDGRRRYRNKQLLSDLQRRMSRSKEADTPAQPTANNRDRCGSMRLHSTLAEEIRRTEDNMHLFEESEHRNLVLPVADVLRRYKVFRPHVSGYFDPPRRYPAKVPCLDAIAESSNRIKN